MVKSFLRASSPRPDPLRRHGPSEISLARSPLMLAFNVKGESTLENINDKADDN